MAVITTINAGDAITSSRTVLNANLANLNSDKIETSVLDTDTALTANSDTKVATQRAVKAYVDGGATNASETTKGPVEEATDAEVTAGTAIGTTGAKLFVTPAKLATRLSGLTSFGDGSDGSVTISSPTTLTKDMYYINLTVTSTLTTSGYRVFVSGTLSGTGTITWGTANAGSNASGVTGGAGGVQGGAGQYKNLAGGAGGNQSGANGSSGAATTPSIGSLGGSGGIGGSDSPGFFPFPGNGAGAAVITPPVRRFGVASWATIEMLDIAAGTIALLRGSSGGGGGGGGVSNASGNSGAGGGGGAGGGMIIIIARTWAGTLTLNVAGGAGGNGSLATGASSPQAGGGGGAGGAGGVIVLVFGTKTWTGSYVLTGGAAGLRAAGGTGSADGAVGATGISYEYAYSSLL